MCAAHYHTRTRARHAAHREALRVGARRHAHKVAPLAGVRRPHAHKRCGPADSGAHAAGAGGHAQAGSAKQADRPTG